MGNATPKRDNYTDIDEIEENEIRAFELEFGGFKKSLNEVIAKICVEKELIELQNVEEFIFWDSNSIFLNFIQKGYFNKVVDGKKYYDGKKIILLVFLLTNHSSTNYVNKKYHDKASFIFQYVRSRNDQNMSEPITENEENFIKFIDDIIDVACVGIVDSYVKQKKITREGYLLRLREIKKEIAEKIIEQMFKTDLKHRSSVLTFETLNELFVKNNFFLTSGFVRNIGWDILINGKANEMDNEESKDDKKGDIKKDRNKTVEIKNSKK